MPVWCINVLGVGFLRDMSLPLLPIMMWSFHPLLKVVHLVADMFSEGNDPSVVADLVCPWWGGEFRTSSTDILDPLLQHKVYILNWNYKPDLDCNKPKSFKYDNSSKTKYSHRSLNME